MSLPPGELVIKPHTANIKLNPGYTSKLNPYTKIKVGDCTQTTPADMGAGPTPKWNYWIQFRRSFEEVITIEVWNMHRFTRNDMLGAGQITMTDLRSNNYYFRDWIELKFKGKDVGHLLVEILFRPDYQDETVPPVDASAIIPVEMASSIVPIDVETTIIASKDKYVVKEEDDEDGIHPDDLGFSFRNEVEVGDEREPE